MKCPVATEPHPTECNKYLKCASLGQVTSWITMKCPEGLIYDKNLRSCAIPGDNWECYSDNDEDSEQDEKNVYGIKNLDISQDEPEANNDDEFLEVIDENLNSVDSQSESSFNDDNASGDGEIVLDVVTQSPPTIRMITTQLQRLTQLMQHVKDKNDGVVDDEEVTAEDLNSFLATQKIQSDSSEYQRTNFNSNDKTPMPSNGRIHPDILSNILDRQGQLNSETNRLTTLSMDATTPKAIPTRPVNYFNRDPITEIKLNSGLNSDGTGTGSHQIVVNRPEGSVLFNVPSPDNQHHQSPYLSEDILKTILEISKQMVTQNHQKQEPQVSYAPQPFYYGVPIPIISPQNNAQNYYSHDYRNNVTEVASPVAKTKAKPNRVQIVPSHLNTKISQKSDNAYPGYVDTFGYYHHEPSAQQQYPSQNHHQNNPQSYQNPNYYFQNYPSYSNGYQNYQQFPASYQYPTKNQYSGSQNYNQQYNFDGAYYGNRPFVIESSAPSYVEHSVRQKPFQKESYATSYQHDDEEKSDENLYDEVDFDEPLEKPDKKEQQLICSYVVQRQANTTDCFRYYVCNAKTKEVIGYSCPIFTAFNDQTKFCDSLSYSNCKKIKERESSVSQNQRIYTEANKALEQVKKESQKVERIASMVRKESQKIYKRRNQYSNDYQQEQTQAFYQQPNYGQAQREQNHVIRQQSVPSAPIRSPRPKPSRKAAKKKKRKVKCTSLGNIVDPESSSSYWHCFKGTDGRMKRINRQCTTNFVFCPVTRFCSPANRC